MGRERTSSGAPTAIARAVRSAGPQPEGERLDGQQRGDVGVDQRCRQARTRRCGAASARACRPRAARATVCDWSGCTARQRRAARRAGRRARRGRTRRGRPAPGRARRAGCAVPRRFWPLSSSLTRRRAAIRAPAGAALAAGAGVTPASAARSASSRSAVGRGGLLGGGVDQVRRGGEARADARAAAPAARAPPGAGGGPPRRVASRRARPTWPCAARAANAAIARVDPVASHRARRHGRGRRHAQPHQPAARPDGRQQVLRRRRAQQRAPPRGGGSSSALSSALAACSGEPVGVLDERCTCQRPRRSGRAAASRDDLAGLVDADHRPSGTCTLTSGCVPAGAACCRRRSARSPPPARHCSAGRERPGGDRAAGAGRAGEQPGVGHPVARGRRGGPRGGAAARRPLAAAPTTRVLPTSRRRRSRARAAGVAAPVPREPAARRPAHGRATAPDSAPASAARWRRRPGSAPASRSASAQETRPDPVVELQRLAPRAGPARRAAARASPTSGARSSSTVRSGTRPPVAQRDSRATSSTASSRPAPW